VDIELVGASLSFPEVCSCCGDATASTRMVGHTRHMGRVKQLTRWTVPCCDACSAHIEAGRYGGAVATLLFFLALLTLGLLSPLLWLWIRHKRKTARALCGQTCGSYEGMTYAPVAVAGNTGHRFTGAHRNFVSGLARANRAAVRSAPPDVLAELGQRSQ
jgi:hypothetical protein